MKIKKYIITTTTVLTLLLIVNVTWGQQEPVIAQYNFNTQLINPAYTGTWENSGFMLLGRHQWMGMEGAPRTYALTFQTSDIRDDMGLGFNIMSDIIGREKRLGVFGDYSHRFQVDETSFLRLGLKFGFTNYENNFSRYIQYPGQRDPSIQYDRNLRFMPNFGVGAYWYSKDYYFGISVPKLIQNDFEDEDNYSTQAELRHFYLIAGYVFELSEYLKFKPTLLGKATVGAPVNFDITANFLIADQVWLGGLYRSWQTFGFIGQWVFDNQLRVGYAVEFSANKIQTFNHGTHEIMVTYEFDFGNREKKWSNPRMF